MTNYATSCENCGLPLIKQNIEELSNIGQYLSKTVWANLCSKNNGDNKLSPNGANNPLEKLNSPDFFELVWSLTNLLIEYNGSHPLINSLSPLQNKENEALKSSLRSLRVEDTHTALCFTLEIFNNWPGNWRLALEGICQGEQAYREAPHQKRRTFLYELFKLFNAEKWDWLRNSVVEFIDIVGGNEKYKYWQRFIDASKQADLTHPNQKISQGEVTLFVKPTVRKIPVAPNTKELLGFQETCQKLGITRNNLIDLIRTGLLKSETKYQYGNKVRWRFSLSEVEKTKTLIIGNQPKLIKENPTEIFLHFHLALKKLRAYGIGFIDLTTAILNQAIPFEIDKRSIGLNAICFKKEDLINYKNQWQFPNGKISYSIYDSPARRSG